MESHKIHVPNHQWRGLGYAACRNAGDLVLILWNRWMLLVSLWKTGNAQNTFYIRCHLIWLRGQSSCWWWQQTKSKISSWLFTFLSAAIWFDLGDSLAAGGYSKRSPRSAHGCSRFISAAIWFDFGDFPAAGGDSKRSLRSAHGCSRL